MERPLKILFVLHSHICGGAEKHTVTLMRALKRQGHQVFFCGPSDSWLHEQLTASGILSIHTPLHGYCDFYSLILIIRTILKHQIDIVHGHMTRGALYAGFAGKLTGRKSVSTAHLMDSYKRFQHTDRIIAVSDAVKNMLIEKGHDHSRIRTILNGIDFPQIQDDQREEVRRELGLRSDDTALCMLSFPEFFKGHDLALAALKRLTDPRLKLIVIGRTEGVEHAKTLQELAISLGIAEQVMFLGHRDDVYRLLSGMDIFLMPSRREACSLAMIEAAASGLPVIASRVGGLPEILEEDVSGVFFEVGNAEELADKIRYLVDSLDLRVKLGRNARSAMRIKMDGATMTSRTLDLYRELCQNHRLQEAE